MPRCPLSPFSESDSFQQYLSHTVAVKTIKKEALWKQDPKKLPEQGRSLSPPNPFPLVLESGSASVFEQWTHIWGQERRPLGLLGSLEEAADSRCPSPLYSGHELMD